MDGWLGFYADVLLGLGVVGSIVSLGLYVEARWIGLPRVRQIGRWSIRV